MNTSKYVTVIRQFISHDPLMVNYCFLLFYLNGLTLKTSVDKDLIRPLNNLIKQ